MIDLQFIFWKILFKTISSAPKLTKPIEDTLLRDESSKGFEHECFKIQFSTFTTMTTTN